MDGTLLATRALSVALANLRALLVALANLRALSVTLVHPRAYLLNLNLLKYFLRAMKRFLPFVHTHRELKTIKGCVQLA